MQLLIHSRLASVKTASFSGGGGLGGLVALMTRFQHGSRYSISALLVGTYLAASKMAESMDDEVSLIGSPDCSSSARSSGR